ncbi:hypothetical protein [Umezawaea beigongshangensis]|uniref:hypothetical protein n=1 Tax=Umezawaea beigongshangensis TaxID=2780383 RepID=UPI0018F10A75|nr:hypothetical protein [Umezawaea beigongshangensis]
MAGTFGVGELETIRSLSEEVNNKSDEIRGVLAQYDSSIEAVKPGFEGETARELWKADEELAAQGKKLTESLDVIGGLLSDTYKRYVADQAAGAQAMSSIRSRLG